MRFLIAIICLLYSSGAISANLRDSIGVENNNGSQLILHKVERKETYYSIARIYNVTPRSIIEFNKNVSLQKGLIIKVPTTRPVGSSANLIKNSTSAATGGDIIDYKVGPKEYLYSIAKRFNTTVEDIKQLNNLKSNNLSIGQLIKVRQGNNTTPVVLSKPQPVNEPAVNTTAIPAEKPAEPVIEKPKVPTGRLGVAERSERGVAVWIKDENLDGTKMLALHRTAPVGTVIKVTNPMTDKVTFAKVVGKFTENESTKDVIIVLTKAAADLLGALDKRFQVTLDYGMPNE